MRVCGMLEVGKQKVGADEAQEGCKGQIGHDLKEGAFHGLLSL